MFLFSHPGGFGGGCCVFLRKATFARPVWVRGKEPSGVTERSPSSEELFDGRTADGSRPSMPSAGLDDGWTDPIPGGDENKTALEIERDRLDYEIDRQHLSDLDLTCRFARKMVHLGLHAIDHPEEFAGDSSPERKPGASEPATEQEPEPDNEAPENTPPSPARQGGADRGGRSPYEGAYKGGLNAPRLPRVGEGDAGVDVPEPAHDQPKEDSIQRQERELIHIVRNATRESTPRVAVPRPGQLKLEQAIMIGERGSKLLIDASARRAELAHKLVAIALQLDTRKSFLQDRAVAVVYATLLHMEETFREVGFGSWMPFRYPDQWLAFCGIMRRVLAANGLIHSENAETYRKLLDETPPVEGEPHDRAKQARSPENIAQAHGNRGVGTLAELAERLKPKPP